MSISLNFRANNSDEERKMIQFISGKKKWFDKNGYKYILPSEKRGLHYDKKKYQIIISKIKNNWLSRDGSIFLKKVSVFFNINYRKKILVNITMYGTGGMYDVNSGSIFINPKLGYDSISVIKHEIIHLFLEKYVRQFAVSHEKKEKMVQSIFLLLGS